ncbi:hypothetical protein BV898_00329 [Hypsibius exemplaris]|uniref:RING-type domain-containing protein n=1 Tax=Hypsibius exemplaris TaxID=2072580 RepID=A0A1W0XFF3_HYPEX|nr:hypothetical protein BV898_00329 [Hypsibius exemplaris]
MDVKRNPGPEAPVAPPGGITLSWTPGGGTKPQRSRTPSPLCEKIIWLRESPLHSHHHKQLFLSVLFPAFCLVFAFYLPQHFPPSPTLPLRNLQRVAIKFPGFAPGCIRVPIQHQAQTLPHQIPLCQWDPWKRHLDPLGAHSIGLLRRMTLALPPRSSIAFKGGRALLGEAPAAPASNVSHDGSGTSGPFAAPPNRAIPSTPQSFSSPSTEANWRLSDFNAMMQEEEQQARGAATEHESRPSWVRNTAPLPPPPPNVNPFGDRARPSVISHSGPSQIFPPRIPVGPNPTRDDATRFNQMRSVNEQRSRMAAEEYIRSRDRAPADQVFPSAQQRLAFIGGPFAQRPYPGGSAPPTGEDSRSSGGGGPPPFCPSPFVTVLHTNPGQALPVLGGPVRNSRVRQMPARQPPLLPLPTPPPSEAGASSSSGSSGAPSDYHRWRDEVTRSDPARMSDFFTMVRNRAPPAEAAQQPQLSSRPQIIRNMASPYSRPMMVAPSDYLLRRNSGILSSSGGGGGSSESSSSGGPDIARMRDFQTRINAAAARQSTFNPETTRARMMDTVNINGEQVPVHQAFPTRVTNRTTLQDLRAQHDTNAEARRRLIYMPQTPAHGPYAFTGRVAASLMQFMDAGIFLSNEHGEPKLILEEDVISAIACDTTSFKFDNQFPATDECIICFEEFELQQEVRVLSCNHTHRFHEHCIDKWLIKNKPNCPICRQILPTLDPKKDVVMPIIESISSTTTTSAAAARAPFIPVTPATSVPPPPNPRVFNGWSNLSGRPYPLPYYHSQYPNHHPQQQQPEGM